MLWPGTRSPWIQILPPDWEVTQVRRPNGRLVSSDPGPPFLLPVASFNMKPVRTRGGFRCLFSRWSSSGAGGIRLLQLRAATPNFRQMGSASNFLPQWRERSSASMLFQNSASKQHRRNKPAENSVKIEICCWLTILPVPDHMFGLLQLDYWTAS